MFNRKRPSFSFLTRTSVVSNEIWSSYGSDYQSIFGGAANLAVFSVSSSLTYAFFRSIREFFGAFGHTLGSIKLISGSARAGLRVMGDNLDCA